MSDPLINRVYDLKIAGYDDAILKVNTLTAAFTKMDGTKKKLNEQLQKKLDTGDAAAIKQLTDQIKALEIEMGNLSKKREASAKEVELLARAEKSEADANLSSVKADREKIKSIIDQDKELDRLIAQEEKKAKADVKAANDAKAQAGNYYALLQAQRAAIDLYRITPSASPLFEQVKKGAVDAKAKVDAFNRSLSPDGTLVGEYSKGIINAFSKLGLGEIIKKQKDDITSQLNKLSQESKALAQQLKTAGDTGDASFGKLDQQLRQNITHQEALRTSLHNVESAYASTGNVGLQISRSIADSFKNISGQLAQVAVGYIGFQAVLSGAKSLIHQNAELSDSIAQLQIYLKGSKKDALDLVESLKKIDTRTSLAGLIDIGTIVAKKGVVKEEIAGVTNALDQLFVTLGTEVGDPHEAVGSLVKLVNVYSEDKHVTAKNIGDIGAAIQKLTSSGVATGGFLINFAERLAGVRGITGITIQNVLGLGAALQELGQRNESAATAAQKLILDMFLKPAQYAKAAGESIAQFSKELNTSPVEALIKVAAALKKPGAATEELVASFSEMGIKGARVIGVLGDIAGNSDYMRKRVNDANKSFGDQGSILAANEIKQNTFAATLDKISKKFELIGASRGVQITLAAIAGTIAFLLSSLIPIIGVLGLFGLGWLTLAKEATVAGEVISVTNARMLVLKIQIAATNLALGLLRVYMLGVTIAQTAYNIAISLYTGITTRAAAATALLGNAMRLLPLGIILTIAGLLIASFRALGSEIAGSTDALRRQAIQQRINADVEKEALLATKDRRAEAALLVSVVKDLSISEETRNAALKKLIDLDPAFQKSLVDGKVNYQLLGTALGEYNQKLLKSAELEASRSRQSKEFGKLTDLQAIKQELEIAQKAKTGFGDLSDEAQKAFSKITTSVGRVAFTSDLFNTKIGASDFKTAIADVNKEIDKQLLNVDAAQAVFAEKQKAIDDANKKPSTDGTAPTTLVDTVFETFKKLVKNGGTEEQFSDLLKEIEEQKKKTSLLSKEYKDLNELQQKVKDLLDPKKIAAARASRLTGPQKDAFKDIDAARDEQLAAEKLKFTQLLENEEQYLRNVLRINITAADAKLKILKGNNAEERKQISELRLFKIDQETETNKKILELRSKTIIRNTDDSKRQAETTLNQVNDDPSSTNLDKLRAREQYLSTILAIQAASNIQLDQLEKQFGLKSEENEKKRRDAILEITKDLAKTQAQIIRESYEEQLRLIDESTRRLTNETKTTIATRTINVLQDDSLGPNQKANKLRQLEIEETKNLLAQDVANAKNSLAAKEDALKKGLATEIQVSDAKIRLKLAELAAVKNAADQEKTILEKFTGGLKDAYANLTNFFKGIKADQKDIDAAIGAAIQTVSNTITEAKNNYFENQRQQVDKDKEIALQRLDIQQQQLIDAAQSEEEKASIQAQFDEKRKKEEKKAGEEKKKIALTQLAIDFGLAVVKTLAAYPFPFSLIPVAALAAYYAVQRGQVNKQQFDKGGFTGPGAEKDHTGHRVAGVVHDNEWVSPKWMVGHPTYGRVIHQLENVRTRGYADGGFTGLGNFKLGDNLQAPVNSAAFLNPSGNSGNSSDMKDLKAMVAAVTNSVNNVSNRIDNIKVQVVAKEVDDRNTKTKKASARGTI